MQKIVTVWINKGAFPWNTGTTPMKLPDELKNLVYVDMVTDHNNHPEAYIYVAAYNTSGEAREFVKKLHTLEKGKIESIKINSQIVFDEKLCGV